ncbi:ABC transporter substrate-binding protein [Chloroflexota bacterium]
MKIRKLLKLSALICLTLVMVSIPFLSGCTSADKTETLKVGLSICYSGVAASKGSPMGNAKLDCIEYINEELGGVNGYQIEVLWRDNEYNASKATTIINELMNAGCLMFTTNSSAMMTASAEVANRQDFPGFAVFSAPALTNPPQHIYAQMPDYGDDWAAFAEYYLANIWEGPGEPKMAMHLLNNSTGAGARAAAEILADDMGIDIVAWEEHDSTTISEIDSITRIMAEDPDILYISSTPQPTSIIVKNAVEKGLYPGITIACGHASFTSVLVELAGTDAESVYGVYPTVNWGDDVPAMDKMTEYCLANHPEDYGNMDYITSWAEGLLIAEILRLALEEVGIENMTPQAVEEYGFKALNNFNVGGLHGPVSYTEGDNRLAKSVRIFQVQSGVIVPLTGWVEAPLIPYVFD